LPEASGAQLAEKLLMARLMRNKRNLERHAEVTADLIQPGQTLRIAIIRVFNTYQKELVLRHLIVPTNTQRSRNVGFDDEGREEDCHSSASNFLDA
jgi:hypothetical protein